MQKITVILMLVAFFSKVGGFLRDLVLAHFFGATYITDAFMVAQTVPNLLFGFLSTALVSNYIPMYHKITIQEDSQRALKYTNNILTATFIFSLAVILLGFLFTEPLVMLFASGFEKGQEAFLLTVDLTRIMFLGAWFTLSFALLSSFLQIHHRFIVASCNGFTMNLIVIAASYLAFKHENYHLFGYGIVAAGVIQNIILIPSLKKSGYTYSFEFDLKCPYLKRMIILALPLLLATAVNQLNVLIDRTIASHLGEGAISALTYASRFQGLVLGLFVLPLSTVMYPLISKQISEKQIDSLQRTILIRFPQPKLR